MIAYVLKSSLSLLLLFGLYWFLLRSEKLFIFTRYFLLFSLIFSLLLPFISIPLHIQANEAQKNIITLLNGNPPAYEQGLLTDISNQQYSEAESITEAPAKISFIQILILVYFLGLILSLFRFTKNIFNLYRQIQTSESTWFSGRKIVLIDNQINPYCFFNTIFVCKQDYLNNKIVKEFLTHELEHIRQSHSIDIILIELIRIVYWFNPILILYSRAIRTNHEYLADNGVLRDTHDIENYADKLLILMSRETKPLTSGLNHSLMKKRLLMLTKPKSKSIVCGLRISLTMGLISLIFLLLGFKPSGIPPAVLMTNHKVVTEILLSVDDSLKSSIFLNHKLESTYLDKKNKQIDNSISDASGPIESDAIVALSENEKTKSSPINKIEPPEIKNVSGEKIMHQNMSDFLFLNSDQLKPLGIELNKNGVFYKNFNPKWKEGKARYSCISFYSGSDNYLDTYHNSEKEGIKAGNKNERLLKRMDMTRNDFYPILIGNPKGKQSLDNKTLPEDLMLFPVAICMSETKLRNRKDTIVVWFKPSESLKKALPENVKIEDFLKVPIRSK